ncbi:hypothetical protein ATK17_0236 [Branchiibius hedensis]|uniref:Uncharacterized protein n=1 Tax=Branchiibius hedensis TaxID=672460 RepID=A0A2Y8ZNM6_9MICO|nr:hypothetical protein [Branchiibius hedensis]PWJ24148.1 hypothetical protein ATK17_0236 [Branchiibius hedensis]SSA32966.1 hypothetical protein SAMN04489750_0236 [Branchiibius hedensis]
MSRRTLKASAIVGSCVVLASAAVGVGAQTPAGAATVSQDGLYHPSTPSRLLDTRTSGGAVAAGKTVVIPRSKLTALGLPATGVQSVVVNLTVTGATGAGWGTIFSGATAPATSNINFTKGWTGAVSSTVALASTSGLSIQIGGSGKTNVIVDLEGWYSNAAYTTANGSGFEPFVPDRWVDTRKDGGMLLGQYYDTISMDWPPDSGNWTGTTPTALLVNLTALGAKGSGSLSLWNGDETRWPSTSSVNFAKGETSPNTAVVPVRRESDGSYSFGVANTGQQPVNYLLDVLGVYYSGNVTPTFKHVVVKPTRVMNFVAVGKQQTVTTKLGSSIGSPMLTGAVEGTLTGYKPSTTSYQTIWDGSGTRPGTSNLNSVAGGVRANGFLAREGSEEALNLSVYNSDGSMKVIVDVTGRFDWTGPTTASTPVGRQSVRAVFTRTSMARTSLAR